MPFILSFVEEKTHGLIQYRCEHCSDITAVVETENGAHGRYSICATSVVPQESFFVCVLGAALYGSGMPHCGIRD